jgi:hypothetical protein
VPLVPDDVPAVLLLPPVELEPPAELPLLPFAFGGSDGSAAAQPLAMPNANPVMAAHAHAARAAFL